VTDNRLSETLQVVVAGVVLIGTAPLVGAAAALVRLSTGDHPLFTQTRVGLHGRPFAIYKLRSMRPGSGPDVTVGDDQRITPVGRVIRQTKIDELPQLVNVVRRDMNLVGPRPEMPDYVDLWPEETREAVLSVRPGITSLASVKFINESTMLAAQDDPTRYYTEVLAPMKLAIETEYVQRRNLALDGHVIAKTFLALVTSKRTDIGSSAYLTLHLLGRQDPNPVDRRSG